MKTIQHYLDQLDKTKNFLNGDDLIQELSVPYFYLDRDTSPELTCYYSDLTWICTDTQVGLRFYFFNDELACASMQNARKSDEEFHWVSLEIRNKVRDYLLQKFIEEIKKEEDNFIQLDLSQDLTDIAEYHGK